MLRTVYLAAILTCLSDLADARGQSVWTGAVSTDWNTAGNWNPSDVPNSATAAVSFTGNGNGTVNISSSVQAQSLTFGQPSGVYFLESNPNLTLSGVTAITLVNRSAEAVVAPSTLLFTGNLTITGNADQGPGLIFQGVIGTPGTGGVIVAGSGNTNLSGPFASGGNSVAGGLTKFGPGGLDFAGSGATLGGGITLNGGQLDLDYHTNTTSKLATGSLALEGGVLLFFANSATAVNQTMQAGTAITGGHTDVLGAGAGTVTFTTGGVINRSAGTTADFSPSTGTTTFTIATATSTANGLLGTGPAYATVAGGSTWATVVSGNVVGLSSYAANNYTNTIGNVDVTAPATPATFTVNSLRFNTGNLTLSLSGTNTLQSGGILVTASAGGGLITGGTLTAPNAGELLVHVYDGATFAINSALVSTAGLTKTGPGTLTLGGNNTGLTGPININRGNLTVSGSAAPVNSAAALNFNDDRSTLQQFTVILPDNTNATINPPIRLSAFGATDSGLGTYFSTSITSRVTLAGVVSSATGLTTPIRFTGNLADSSGFNLTNANTFTGDVTLANGTLGITADASLGNAANTLFLQVNDSANGGLQFLDGGITVARPVVLNASTRIVSNGSDSNTISGVISGSSGLAKDGTGALTLGGNNSGWTGGLFVNAGTLVLGHPNALGNPLNGWTVGFGGTLDLGGQAVAAVGPGLVISGTGVGGNGALINSSAMPASFAGLVNDNINPGGISFSVGGPGDITLSGSINKNTTLTKIGSGTLTLSGTTDNFGLGAVVNAGTLVLAKTSSHSPDVHAIGGNPPLFGIIVSGGTAQLGGTGGDQIFDGGGVTVTSGTFDTNGRSETIDTLHLQGTGIGGAGALVNTAAGASVLTIQTTSQIGTTLTADATIGVPQGSLTINGSFGGAFRLTKTGAGNLALIGPSSPSTALQVNAGNLFLAGSNWGTTTINAAVQMESVNAFSPQARVTLNGGFLFLNGFDQSIGSLAGTAGTVTLLGSAQSGATLTVGSDNTSTTFAGTFVGPGTLAKVGTGTLTLGTGQFTNTFTSLTISGGTVQTADDATLGPNPAITVNAAGTLLYTANTSSARTFNLNFGTLAAAAGTTLTLNGAAINGGFVRGPGTFALTTGTTLAGVTTLSSATLNQTGPASFVNVTNGSTLMIASGLNSTMTGLTNQGSGSITLGALGTLNVSDFQTYGTLTLNPATVTENFSQTTLMTNVGTSQLYFNGGSRTFVGTPATAVFPSNWPDVSLRGTPTFVAGIDLNGKNAVVAGGLFVNNGYVEDSTNNFAGTATIVADFGSLVKGAGFFQNTVVTQNGGKFQAGNSPGAARFGKFVLGPGGVSSYVFAIDDATGAAGPTPDAAGHVSGWGLVRVGGDPPSAGTPPGTHGGLSTQGDFVWTSTATDKLTVAIQTLLNPTMVGVDVPGAMDHFDPNLPYQWPAIEWSGAYAGPTDAATLDASTAFDLGVFANPIDGTFAWAIDDGNHTLSLTYTPTAVPEPGALALVMGGAAGWLVRRRVLGTAARNLPG